MTTTAITDIKQNTAVKEMIGRSGYDGRNAPWRYRAIYTTDRTITDYAFWDRLRRGEAWGYRLGGLFAQPIAEIIASWSLGGGTSAKLADNVKASPEQIDYTNGLLARFSDRIQGMLLSAVIDLYCLGDMYIMVNPDGSLSVPSPDTVEVVYDARDFHRPIEVKITTRTQGAQIIDVWTDRTRTLTVTYYGGGSRARENPVGTVERVYDNLLGRIPIVHFANDRGTNEINGRPIFEALLYLFERYDDLITKSLDGAELMGNPIPAFVGMKDVNATKEALLTTPNESITDDYDVNRSDQRINWDILPAVFLGEGGDFKFVSPGTGYTVDIREMLRALELEMIYKARIPEVVWGKELSSANHTAVEQMKTFYMYIEGRRLMLEGDSADDELDFEPQGGLLAVYDLWLRTQRLIHGRKVLVAPCVMRWPELSSIDQRLQFEWTQWLYGSHLMTPVEALAQSQLVESAEAEIAAVEKLSGAPVVPPALPPQPNTPQAMAQPETVAEADGSESLFMALDLANNPDLIALQKRLRQLYPAPDVRWNVPTDYHVTLLYAPTADEALSNAFAQAVQAIPLPELKLGVGGLHVFDNVGEHALHFRIKSNPALREYQAQLYAAAQQVGIALNSYSNPDAWTPHITMGYLPDKTRTIPYEAKFSVTPSGVLLKRGETDLTANAGAVVQEMKTAPHVLREITWCIGGGSSSTLPDAVTLYIRHIAETVTDKTAICAAAVRHYNRITIAEAIQATRLDFETAVEDLLSEALGGNVDRRRFGLRLRNLVEVGIRKAYLDGLEDGGVKGAELDDDDLEWLDTWTAEQRDYIRNLTDAIYKDERVTPDEATGKPILWWNKSIAPAYARAILSASTNAAFMRVLGSTEDHCRDCLKINGQVRRASFWKKIGVWDASPKTECGGWRCECKNLPTDAPVSRGRFPSLIGGTVAA